MWKSLVIFTLILAASACSSKDSSKQAAAPGDRSSDPIYQILFDVPPPRDILLKRCSVIAAYAGVAAAYRDDGKPAEEASRIMAKDREPLESVPLMTLVYSVYQESGGPVVEAKAWHERCVKMVDEGKRQERGLSSDYAADEAVVGR